MIYVVFIDFVSFLVFEARATLRICVAISQFSTEKKPNKSSFLQWYQTTIGVFFSQNHYKHLQKECNEKKQHWEFFLLQPVPTL